MGLENIYASNFSTSANANIPKLTNRPNSGQTAVAGRGRRICTAGRRRLEKFWPVAENTFIRASFRRGRGTTGFGVVFFFSFAIWRGFNL
jgi:hypothetical protein